MSPSSESIVPPGLKLLHTLRGHKEVITQLAWAPDGTRIASSSKDDSIRIWATGSGTLRQQLSDPRRILRSRDEQADVRGSVSEIVFNGNLNIGGHTSDSTESDTGVMGISWSPHADAIAFAIGESGARIWRPEDADQITELTDRTTNSVAWSSNGETIVIGSSTHEFRLWDLQSNQFRQRTYPIAPKAEKNNLGGVIMVGNSISGNLVIGDNSLITVYGYPNPYRPPILPRPSPFRTIEHDKLSHFIGWSPDNQMFVSVSGGNEAYLRNAKFEPVSGQTETLKHDDWVLSAAFSGDGKLLASACSDGIIQIWEVASKRALRVLEAHADTVTSIAFSFDSRFLASKSLDNTIRIWRCDTWETVAVIPETTSLIWPATIAFHPKAPLLATFDDEDSSIRIWELDFDYLLKIQPVTPSVNYVNAKAVLVGDSGGGKSGLALVLTGNGFEPTESTHGRRVYTFDKHGSVGATGRAESREILLWDLAGQPGYRLIHQLHLDEIAVALIVFDARSETDPFGGVRHWARALRQAQLAQTTGIPPMKKLLVAARADRGTVAVNQERIDALLDELQLDGYIETSAKEGWGISKLDQLIKGAVDWTALPKVTSTRLFAQIKDFLSGEKDLRRLLSSVDDLYRAFLKSSGAPQETNELRSQFEVCIGRVESRGLIRRLTFGNLILLQPELLDAYASALINVAKSEPDGMGSILEEDARTGRFRMPDSERLKNKEQEKLLLIATIDDLLRHEIALRESSDEGTFLVFPSQLMRENPDLPDPVGKSVIFKFDGAVLNLYVTLAVRLSHSGLFQKKDLWKNAAIYTASIGGQCGMYFRELQEGQGELTLFFDLAASDLVRLQFEQYIQAHLQRRALPGTLTRRRVFSCPVCGTIVSEQAVIKRRERQLDWIICNVCDDVRISLLDQAIKMDAISSEHVDKMDQVADAQRELETAKTSLEGKMAIGEFDVFLCHNSVDKPVVKKIGELLKLRGIRPWLDEWELRPGQRWQTALEEQIGQIKSALVFVGDDGIGPWQNMELQAFLGEFVSRNCPVIPVISPDCVQTPELPIFLRGFTWVDFRKIDPDPLGQLIWGITGQKAGSYPPNGITDEITPTRDIVQTMRIVKIDEINDAFASKRAPDAEMRELLDVMTNLLVEIKKGRIALPNADLNEKAKKAAEVFDDAKADMGHKIKVALPIIPGILSYETEIEIAGGMNLRTAWKNLVAKLRPAKAETAKGKI